jgi:hypothetical protein
MTWRAPSDDGIQAALAKHGIVGPEQRHLAERLRAIGGIAADVDALVEVAGKRGAESPVGLVVHWLRGDPEDVATILGTADRPDAPKLPAMTFGSDPSLATPQNPYGWRSSSQRSTERLRNDTPGEWCPYRQAYNAHRDGTPGGPPANWKPRFKAAP